MLYFIKIICGYVYAYNNNTNFLAISSPQILKTFTMLQLGGCITSDFYFFFFFLSFLNLYFRGQLLFTVVPLTCYPYSVSDAKTFQSIAFLSLYK